jgi:ATP-dependent helicase/nuclease subunit B
MKSFLQEVAQDLYAQMGEDLKDTAIIFNNKRPVAYMQEHLAKVIGKPFWSPSFFTIQEFFSLTSANQVADSYTQFFTLLHQYNQLLEQEGRSPIRPDAFYGTSQTILSDFAQIDMDLAPAKELFTELEDTALIQQQFQHLTDEQQEFLTQFWKSFSAGRQQAQQEQFIRMWRRMPKLYEGFHNTLTDNGHTTRGQIYRKLAERQEDKPDFMVNFKKLVFVGFNALSKAEAVCFKRWQEEGKALFYFDTDAYYMQDTIQEAGLFLRNNIQRTGLINALGKDRPNLKQNHKTINVYKTQGRTAQAKILQASLLHHYPLLKQSDHTGKVAVILADEQLLFPVLQTIPSSFPDGSGEPLPVNVTMGYSLLSSGIYGLANIWLTVQEQLAVKGKETVYYREAEGFLSHPLTYVSEADRAAIQKQILDGQLIEVPQSFLQQSGELAGLFFTTMGTGLDGINALYRIFETILYQLAATSKLKQTDSDLLTSLLKEINRLSDALTTYAAELSPSFTLALIRKAMQGISVPLQGEPLLGLQVMGLLESRSLDFEHVYILGTSEGVLPKSNGTQTFIPDSIRRAYGLPVPENQDAISAYMFYRLLQRSKSVSLVYNAQPDETNPGEQSRFIRQLEFESGYQFHYFDHVQDMALEQRVRFTVSKQGDVLMKLHAYLENEGLYGKKLSATALTTYMNCPMQFFYSYVAGIKEPEQLAENLEASNVGSILHMVMELFYQELKQKNPEIIKERIAEHRIKVSALCKKAFAEVMYNTPEEKQLPLKGMQQVILAIIERYVNLILNHDENQAPFYLIELENKKDYITPYPLMVNGQKRSVSLFGIIDRVDQRQGVTRIVDYKTGSDELTYTCIDDLFMPDSKNNNKALVQTLFYTHIYEQVRNKAAVEPNLYVVRNMHQDGTLFKEKGKAKTLLQAESLQECKKGFGEQLTNKLEEMFNAEVPFVQTTIDENCSYCPYTTICGK